MKDQIKISDAEWKIMQVLWKTDDYLTTGEIAKALDDSVDWSKRTIQTLIHRLVEKGAVSYEQARYYMYYAKVTEGQCLNTEMKSILRRLFNSSPSKLVLTLVETENLDSNDIDEIIRLLDSIKEKSSND